MSKRGRPETEKPDKEWAARELAQLERETEHHRAAGSTLAEVTAALAAELRAGMGRQWRADKPWAVWKQRGKGILHAQTFDPVEARHLALLIALSEVQTWLYARGTEDAELSHRMAALACSEAAETCGTDGDARPFAAAVAAVEGLLAEGEPDENLERSKIGRERRLELMIVARATGVGVSTLLDVLGAS